MSFCIKSCKHSNTHLYYTTTCCLYKTMQACSVFGTCPMTYSMMCLGCVASSTECRVDLAHTCNLHEQSWPFKTTAWMLRVCLMCSTWMSVCSEKLKYLLSHCVHMQKLFEALFSHWPLHWVFADSSGSLREWWFRVQLDRHVSGMGIAPWNCVRLANVL